MTESIDIGLSITRAFFGFLLILFIPGYAVIWALFPNKSKLPGVERIALSFVTSVGLTIIIALSLDLILGVDTTPFNLTLALLLVALLCGSLGILIHYIQPKAKIAYIATIVFDRAKIFFLKKRQSIKAIIRR
jgi:uncharacterized membrane protein